MNKLILLAALLISTSAAALSEFREIVLHNRSTTSDLVAFSVQRNGILYESWLAGEEWPEVNAIEPGASSTFTQICSTLPSVYIVDIVSVYTTWRDRETMEHTDLSEDFDPCDYAELYLTPQGEVGR